MTCTLSRPGLAEGAPHEHRSPPRLWRSRWAAIGAAIAVTLGAGGLATTFADSAPSTLVAITPVRILDTRIAAMGPALTSGTPRLLDVTGAIPTVGADGSTIATASPIPDGATAIVANVTIVSPTTNGFVSVRPGSATGTPTTSSLNAAAAGVVVPNSVTVEIPTTGPTAGQVQLWFQGTTAGAITDLLVDIVGYYQPPAPTSGATTYVGTFRSAASTGIGDTAPPAPPTNYTASFDLTPGRYFVTGDLTVRNGDTVDGAVVICQLYYNEVVVGRPAYQRLDASEPAAAAWEQLSFADTFDLAVGGPTTVSFRCVRQDSPAMYYEFINMTLFRAG